MTEFDLSELLDLRKRGHCLGPGQLRALREAQNSLTPDKEAEMSRALNEETRQDAPGTILIVEEVQSTRTENIPLQAETAGAVQAIQEGRAPAKRGKYGLSMKRGEAPFR